MIGKDLINNAFDSFLEEPLWLFHLIADSLIVTYDFSKAKLDNTISASLAAINVNQSDTSKFLPVYRNLLKEYFDSIFAISKKDLEEIKSNLREAAKQYTDFPINSLDDDMEESYFNKYLRELIKSSLFMLINDPPLTFDVQPYLSRKPKYSLMSNKKHFFINGSFYEGAVCLTILPQPLLKDSFPYNGILEGVFILDNPPKDLIAEIKEKEEFLVKIEETTEVAKTERKQDKEETVENKRYDILTKSNHMEGAMSRESLIKRLKAKRQLELSASKQVAVEDGLKSYHTSKTIDFVTKEEKRKKSINMPKGNVNKSGDKSVREGKEEGISQ